MLLETSAPEIVRLEKTTPRRRRTSPREDTSHLTSPEKITIQEVEPAPLPSIEFGQDLPEVSALDLELLMSDLPTLPEVETLPEPPKRRTAGEPVTRERPKDAKEVRPKVPKADRETISGTEAEGETHLAERISEVDSFRRDLRNMESEIERLKEEKRQAELQWEYERERWRMEELERERIYQQAIEKEMERLQRATSELEQLHTTGAAEQLLLEKEQQIQELTKMQKEKQHQWEAQKLEQQLKDQEKEREYLRQREQEKQRLREAEKEINRLKKALAEKQQDETEREAEKEIRREEERVDERQKTETAGSPVRSSPKRGHPSEMLSEPDAAGPLEEVAEQPMDFFPEGALEIRSPVTAALQVSPRPSSPQLMLPEVPLEAGRVPSFRRPARRTSLIVDKDTQIGSKIMQDQTSDSLIHTQPAVPVIIPHMKSRTPASLFESPTLQMFMAAELTELWSRCAFSEPLQYIYEREEGFISELEEVRAGTESGASMLLSSEFSLEVSEEDRSRPILLTPEERRSPSGQEDRFLPMVSEMPELIVELPEIEEVLQSDLQRKLHSEVDSAGHSEFLSLTPHSLPRLLVSRFFFSCLVLCTQQVIQLEQTEPYGGIVITKGRCYSQG